MRLGLDGIPLAELKTGVGHYTFELARALALTAPADEIEIVSPFPYLPPSLGESGRAMPPNLRAVHQRVKGMNRRWWLFGLPTYIRHSKLALFHGTNYDVPLRSACPTILTIHDLSPFYYPETHEASAVRRARFRMPLMARAATMIITPTESVRREACARLNISSERTVAVPHAPRSCFRPATRGQIAETKNRLGIEDDFLLFVGTVEPRKNLLMLVRAFEDVAGATGLRPQLVIAGKKGWLSEDLYAYVNKLDVRDRVCWAGYLSDEDLRALYSSCRVFLYPSLYEGFGLPPLEAMACGAPVITSDVSAIVETVGKAARLVSPGNSTEWAQNIVDVISNEDERKRLSEAGLRCASEFTWERAAHLTREVYTEALRRRLRTNLLRTNAAG